MDDRHGAGHATHAMFSNIDSKNQTKPKPRKKSIEEDKEMKRKIWSRVANKSKTLPCENADCGRTDRPLYVWHGPDGRGSILICDICMVRADIPRLELEGT